MIDVTWQAIKDFATTRNLSIQYIDINDNYYLRAFDGGFELCMIIPKNLPASSDQVDFETNFKASGNKKLSPSTDIENANLTRLKYAPAGWAYQSHSIEIKTSALAGVKNLKPDGTSTGFATIKFFKADGIEITSGLQTDLDPLCVKTRVTWEPNHSIEVISGMVMNFDTTAQDIYLNATVAPHIPASFGGSRVFVQSLNLKFIGAKAQLRTDGRASKHIAFDPVYFSHRWQFELSHPAGVKHEFLMMLEFYKA